MSEQAFFTRPAGTADLPALVTIEQACFAIPWSEESLRQDLENNPAARILVAASTDGQLAGYAAYWAVADEAQINNIAVLPAYRRRGLGLKLLESLIQKARSENLRQLFLEVRASNLPARRLYESCGFQIVGCRHGYYTDNGEDAIIMLKKIGEKA